MELELQDIVDRFELLFSEELSSARWQWQELWDPESRTSTYSALPSKDYFTMSPLSSIVLESAKTRFAAARNVTLRHLSDGVLRRLQYDHA